MPKIKIKKSKCKGCELCAAYCPKSLIKIDKKLNIRGVHPAVFTSSSEGMCTGCAFCALICPECAIEVFK